MVLKQLEGNGWVLVEPPEAMDDPSVVARYDGTPIKAGFEIERLEDSEDEIHSRYRSGCYDVDVKIDMSVGRGQLRVQRAEGYSQD